MQVNEIIDAVYATPFAPLKVKPLKLQLNNDSPPELELRFEVTTPTFLILLSVLRFSLVREG